MAGPCFHRRIWVTRAFIGFYYRSPETGRARAALCDLFNISCKMFYHGILPQGVHLAGRLRKGGWARGQDGRRQASASSVIADSKLNFMT